MSAINHRGRVCILTDIEAEQFKLTGVKTSPCVGAGAHDHVKVSEAFEMARQSFCRNRASYFAPIAEWVGPRELKLLRSFGWVIAGQTPKPFAHGDPAPGNPRWAMAMIAPPANKGGQSAYKRGWNPAPNETTRPKHHIDVVR
jgi:hypothetical protein